MSNTNIEIMRRALGKINELPPAQREILCLCAVAYEAGKQAGKAEDASTREAG